jgi:hypothetical protein
MVCLTKEFIRGYEKYNNINIQKNQKHKQDNEVNHHIFQIITKTFLSSL